MLTTVDNPYNPFTHFDSWYAFDTQKKYNSSAYLARIAKTSTEFSDADYEREVEDAINWIIEYDPFKIYTKIYETGEKEPIREPLAASN